MIINKIKGAINKLNVKNSSFLPYIPFVIFFVIIFIWHFMIPPFGDELRFGKIFNENDLLIVLKGRYASWSSRSLIEFFLIPLAGLPRILWNFLDSIIFLLIAVLIPKIATTHEKIDEKKSFIYNVLSCILVLIYILTISTGLWSAGWIATTLNYTWPLSFGVLHFYLVKEYIFKENEQSTIKKIVIYAIMFFALIFAINQELMLFIVAGAYFFIILYCLYNKIKIPKSIFLMLFTIFLGFLNFYLCPGNHLRYAFEISSKFPDYYTLTLINKLDLGITILFNGVLLKNILINLLFFLIFGFYVYSITKKKTSLLISLMPLILIITLKFMVLVGYLPIVKFLGEGITKYGLLHSSLNHIMINTILYAIIMISVIYNLLQIFRYGRKKLGFVILCLLMLGFASQMIRGFSPTCWISGARWEIYYYFSITCIIYILTVELLENKHNDIKITDQ